MINELVPDERSGHLESPYRAEDVALMPGVPAALRELSEHGFLLIVVSNQPAAAKGTASRDALRAVHERVVELLEAQGASIDGSRYCFHHPEGVVPDLTETCDCRKPAPGLILAAAASLNVDLAASWAVGDADRDVIAGRTAGCRTVLVMNPDSRRRRGGREAVDAIVRDLPEASAYIVHASTQAEHGAG